MQIIPSRELSDPSQIYDLMAKDSALYIKRLAEKNRISATQLSIAISNCSTGEKGKVSNSTVSNWMREDYAPSTEHFNSLARLLKIPAWLLLMQITHQIEPPFIPNNVSIPALAALASATEEELKAAMAEYATLPQGMGMKIVKAIMELERS